LVTPYLASAAMDGLLYGLSPGLDSDSYRNPPPDRPRKSRGHKANCER
jgi:hypothetical protein